MFAPPSVRSSAPTSQTTVHTPRPASLQRKSTLKRSIDESGALNPPSSPSKRSRVGWESETELFSADEFEEMDPLVIREEVRRAIQRHQTGDSNALAKIQNIFATPKDEETAPGNQAVKIYLQALLANVSLLNKNCNALVNVVLFSEWVGRGHAFVQLYTKFLGTLAAAQGGYLNKILQMLVDLLGLQATRRLPGCRTVRQPRIHQRVLQALRYVTQLIPVASGTLAEAVKTRLSFDFAKAEERLTFVKNFIELIDFVPELSADILHSIMAELVKLDVSIQAEMDEDEEAEDTILHHISSSQTLVAAASQQLPGTPLRSDEEDDDATTTDESEDEDDDLSEDELRKRKLKANVKQVDLMMDMLFQYYSKQSAKSADDTMDQLISQFHSIILPTYRSRHTQFLVFHFAQTSPVFVDQFVTSCIEKLIDRRQSQYLRHAAAAYFSGFVGRGMNIPPTVVTDCIELLCDQLSDLRKQYEPMCRGPNLKRYGDFYATFQAILYIFCWRWRDLASANADDDSDFEEDGPETFYFSDKLRQALHSAIFSSLNPLRVCTPVIVEQFAKLTHALDFMYLHSKIASNRHVRLHAQQERTMSQLDLNGPDRDVGLACDNGVMEGYFPYDPYELPISKHWVASEYVTWRGIPGEKIVDSDSEDEDEDDDGVMVEVDDEDSPEDEL